MTIHELIKVAVKKLTNSTSPDLDGEVLLSYVLNKPKEYLLAHMKEKVPPKLEKTFLRLINKRLLGWPVAYLVKHKEFYGLAFYVNKSVLIPRPETEGLIELVIDNLTAKKGLVIGDIGTGSGAIIITLAKKLGNKHKFFASDISPQAIKVAKKNAKFHKTKIMFGDGNLLEPFGDMKIDIVVANLPYLDRRTDPSTKYEPTGALIAAKRGTKTYEDLFRQIAKRKLKPQFLALEIGRDQGKIIKKLAKKILPAYEVKIYKDLFGRPRYALVKLAIL